MTDSLLDRLRDVLGEDAVPTAAAGKSKKKPPTGAKSGKKPKSVVSPFADFPESVSKVSADKFLAKNKDDEGDDRWIWENEELGDLWMAEMDDGLLAVSVRDQHDRLVGGRAYELTDDKNYIRR